MPLRYWHPQKIQAVGKFQKMPAFLLLTSSISCTDRRNSIRPRWITYQWWAFWFGFCVFQNSFQNAAMFMVLLLLLLPHTNEATQLSKNLVAACKRYHLELWQNLKQKYILVLWSKLSFNPLCIFLDALDLLWLMQFILYK